MKSYRQQRVEDFEKRAAFSPQSVYRHRIHGWRYIPVRDFAEESPEGHAETVDCWCLLGSDAALLECGSSSARKMEPGLYVRVDDSSPRYAKLHVVLPAPGVTRAAAEAAMERFVELGFPDGPRFQLRPGCKLVCLEADDGSCPQMKDHKAEVFTASDGDACCWLEQGSSVMLKAVTKHGDPVELTKQEAVALAHALLTAAEKID